MQRLTATIIIPLSSIPNPINGKPLNMNTEKECKL